MPDAGRLDGAELATNSLAYLIDARARWAFLDGAGAALDDVAALIHEYAQTAGVPAIQGALEWLRDQVAAQDARAQPSVYWSLDGRSWALRQAAQALPQVLEDPEAWNEEALLDLLIGGARDCVNVIRVFAERLP